MAKQNRCQCREGFVPDNEEGLPLRCKYESFRKVEPITFPEMPDDYEDYGKVSGIPRYHPGMAPFARVAQFDDIPIINDLQPKVVIKSTNQMVEKAPTHKTKAKKKNKKTEEE